MICKPRAALLPLLALAGLQLTAAHSWAQPSAAVAPATAASRPDPTDPKAPVPAAAYRSPLSAYQGFAVPPVAPWRETNERVRQRGGWRAYAREANEAEAPRPAASNPAQGGHAGHPMK